MNKEYKVIDADSGRVIASFDTGWYYAEIWACRFANTMQDTTDFDVALLDPDGLPIDF